MFIFMEAPHIEKHITLRDLIVFVYRQRTFTYISMLLINNQQDTRDSLENV